jgi:hypothetical protein
MRLQGRSFRATRQWLGVRWWPQYRADPLLPIEFGGGAARDGLDCVAGTAQACMHHVAFDTYDLINDLAVEDLYVYDGERVKYPIPNCPTADVAGCTTDLTPLPSADWSETVEVDGRVMVARIETLGVTLSGRAVYGRDEFPVRVGGLGVFVALGCALRDVASSESEMTYRSRLEAVNEQIYGELGSLGANDKERTRDVVGRFDELHRASQLMGWWTCD